MCVIVKILVSVITCPHCNKDLHIINWNKKPFKCNFCKEKIKAPNVKKNV